MTFPHVTINEVCSLITDGTHYTPPNLGIGVPFLTVKNMTPTGLDLISCSRISEEEFKQADSGNSSPKVGDVLFSKDGTVGKVHVVKEDVDFAVLSSIAILRPNHTVVDANYLGKVLQTRLILNQAIKKKTGSAIRRIILSDLKRVFIPLPPLKEQKRIATILDKADAIRRKRQQAIDLTDQLLRSVFLDMFGDPVTNPKGWGKKKLNLFATKISVGHVGPTSEYYTEDGVPLLRTQNVRRMFVNRNNMMQITNEFHAKLKKSTLKADDVLVSRVGVNRGMSCVVPDDLHGANCANILLATLSDKYDSYYLSYLINSEYGQRTLLGASVGSAQGVINTAKLKEWLVYDVPYELQKKFRQFVLKIFDQQSQYQKSIELLNDNFNSLTKKTFSGELSKQSKAA